MALKRQQAAEDAIAMGLRAVATGATVHGYLPPGPIFGMPVTEPQEVSDSEDDGKDSNGKQMMQHSDNSHSRSSDICVKSDDSNSLPGNYAMQCYFPFVYLL